MGWSNLVGKAGEKTAEQFYIEHGFKVLSRNFRVRRGEIDLIVYRDPTLVFVEVKSRSVLRYWEDAMPVSKKQLQRLHWLARIYLHRERQTLPSWREARIDLVLVTQGRVKERISEYVS